VVNRRESPEPKRTLARRTGWDATFAAALASVSSSTTSELSISLAGSDFGANDDKT
jgi:hypothetical protein